MNWLYSFRPAAQKVALDFPPTVYVNQVNTALHRNCMQSSTQLVHFVDETLRPTRVRFSLSYLCLPSPYPAPRRRSASPPWYKASAQVQALWGCHTGVGQCALSVARLSLARGEEQEAEQAAGHHQRMGGRREGGLVGSRLHLSLN